MQLGYITNHSATGTVCVKGYAWSGSSTCSTICTGSGLTCDGSATDGVPVLAGVGMSLPKWDGEFCLCMAASAANKSVTTQRVARGPGQ